ncbi:MAG: ferric reductase-like transmembrane domain-containing protein [Actinobacteria bacterium]|nr:ferric reductase-like transmembrane domain-containing protein [Actinomycetota bacterium]
MTTDVLASSTLPWFVARSTGVVSLALLTAATTLGILSVKRWTPTRSTPRFVTPAFHRNVSLLATAFIVIHVVTVVLDGYAPIGWVATVVPFTSSYRTVWLGLGAIAFDLLLAVLLTSAFRNRLGFKAWKAVHFAAYASWPVAVAHSLGTGTDGGEGWMALAIVIASALLAGLTSWRFTARQNAVRPGLVQRR